MIPNKNGVLLDVTEDLNNLARLTLRQLRLRASDLGVPLYSRKSKAALIKEINLYQSKRESTQPFWRAPSRPSEIANPSESYRDTRVVFLPRDPEWGYVFWEISESDRKRALDRGANRLFIRLSDVTGINNGDAHPHTLQEVPVDSHSTEWYLPIPMCDRDYRVELGYRAKNNWVSLGFSTVARVPSIHPSNQILDQFVPFSLESNPIDLNTPSPITLSTNSKDNALHERLYQSATTHFHKARVGSEEFQENTPRNQSAYNDSGSGLWASGLNDSGIGGIAPTPRSLWLVADAELIVYGSTDPSARLTMGGEEVPLSKEGTFRLQVPFRDGKQKYPIEAIAADGKQKRNITLNFQRTTPEDNSIPKEQAQVEWF